MSTPRDIRLPAMRMIDLIMTETGSDVLVYDQNTSSLHTLNSVTARVWRTLDGTKTAAMVSAETGLSEEIVLVAASRLSDVSLLDGKIPVVARTNESRRSMLKKAGIAAAIPVIVSISAPIAASANSHCELPECTEEGAQCCTGPGILDVGACVNVDDLGVLVCLSVLPQ